MSETITLTEKLTNDIFTNGHLIEEGTPIEIEVPKEINEFYHPPYDMFMGVPHKGTPTQ